MKKTSLLLSLLLILTLFVGVINAQSEISKEKIDAIIASTKKITEKYDIKLEYDKNQKWYDTIEVTEEYHNQIKTSDGYSKGVLNFIAKDTIKVDGIDITLYFYKGRLTKFNFTNKPQHAYIICE